MGANELSTHRSNGGYDRKHKTFVDVDRKREREREGMRGFVCEKREGWKKRQREYTDRYIKREMPLI